MKGNLNISSVVERLGLKSNDVLSRFTNEKKRKIMSIICIWPTILTDCPIFKCLGHLSEGWHSLKYGWFAYFIKGCFPIGNVMLLSFLATSNFAQFITV